MNTDEWKRLARTRIESGLMADAEWAQVISALLLVSEDEGLGDFDDEITKAYNKEPR